VLDAEVFPVATILWEDVCLWATFREDAALALGRKAPQSDKIFLDEELDLIRLFILSQRVNMNAFDRHGRTPLMAAVVNNQPRLARLLLEFEACDVNKQTPPALASGAWRPRVKMTALAIAIEHQRADMVSLLLNAHHLGGQKVDINLEYESSSGESSLPLELAYGLNDDGAIAELLLRTGECYMTPADLRKAAFERNRRLRSRRNDRPLSPPDLDTTFRHARKFKPRPGGVERRPALEQDTVLSIEAIEALSCLALLASVFVVIIAVSLFCRFVLVP